MIKLLICFVSFSFWPFQDSKIKEIKILDEYYFSRLGAFSDLKNVSLDTDRYAHCEDINEKLGYFGIVDNEKQIVYLDIRISKANREGFFWVNDSTLYKSSTKNTFLSKGVNLDGYGSHSVLFRKSQGVISFFYNDGSRSDSLVAEVIIEK